MDRTVVIAAVLLAASCQGRGELVSGSYVNDSTHIQIDVHDNYFVEYVGGREVRGSIGHWENLCNPYKQLLGPDISVVFKGVLASAADSQSNREQTVDWNRDSTQLFIRIDPERQIALDRR